MNNVSSSELLVHSANCCIKYNSDSGLFLAEYSRYFPNSSTTIASPFLLFLSNKTCLSNSLNNSEVLDLLFKPNFLNNCVSKEL